MQSTGAITQEVNGRRSQLMCCKDDCDIRTVQELLGHKDVKATTIYTHVLNHGQGLGAVSMCCEAAMEVFMLIRTRHRDKSSALTQRLDSSAIRLEAMLHPQASYAAIVTVFSALCGST